MKCYKSRAVFRRNLVTAIVDVAVLITAQPECRLVLLWNLRIGRPCFAAIQRSDVRSVQRIGHPMRHAQFLVEAERVVAHGFQVHLGIVGRIDIVCLLLAGRQLGPLFRRVVGIVGRIGRQLRQLEVVGCRTVVESDRESRYAALRRGVGLVVEEQQVLAAVDRPLPLPPCGRKVAGAQRKPVAAGDRSRVVQLSAAGDLDDHAQRSGLLAACDLAADDRRPFQFARLHTGCRRIAVAVAAGGEKYCDGRDRESEPLSEEVCLHSHSKRIGIAGGVTRRRSLSTQFFLKKQNPLP